MRLNGIFSQRFSIFQWCVCNVLRFTTALMQYIMHHPLGAFRHPQLALMFSTAFLLSLCRRAHTQSRRRASQLHLLPPQPRIPNTHRFPPVWVRPTGNRDHERRAGKTAVVINSCAESQVMGGGGHYDYPKHVWSPAGGWMWERAPRAWKRNTGLSFLDFFVLQRYLPTLIILSQALLLQFLAFA